MWSDGSRKRWKCKNIVLEGSRRRRNCKNNVPEDSRRRWNNNRNVLEASGRRWMDKTSVFEASGRCPRSLEAGGFSQFGLGAVGSTKIVVWSPPGGAGSTKIVFWRAPGGARSAKIVFSATPWSATTGSGWHSDRYPGPHQSIHFLHDSHSENGFSIIE